MIKEDKKFKALMRRIKRLPQKLAGKLVIRTGAKYHADAFLPFARARMEKDEAELTRLRPGTVARKRAEGLPRPETPLVGEGRRSDQSMMNLLVAEPTARGYRVIPRGRHHSGMSARRLFIIHERGTSDGRVPPRFLLRRLTRLYLKSRAKKEASRQAAREIKKLILVQD